MFSKNNVELLNETKTKQKKNKLAFSADYCSRLTVVRFVVFLLVIVAQPIKKKKFFSFKMK